MRVATRRLAPGRPGREGHLGGQAATANGQRVMLLFEARMRKQGNSKAQVWRPTRSKLRGGMESGGLEPQGEKVAVRRSLGCKAGRQGTIGLRWESKGTARPHIFQALSRVGLSVTPRTVACQAALSFTVSQSLLKRMSIE